jgi:hypothetical protein
VGGAAAALIGSSFPATLRLGGVDWTGDLTLSRDGFAGQLVDWAGPTRMSVTVAAADFHLCSASSGLMSEGGRIVRERVPFLGFVEELMHPVAGDFLVRFPGLDEFELNCEFRDSHVTRAMLSAPDGVDRPAALEIPELLAEVTDAFRRPEDI